MSSTVAAALLVGCGAKEAPKSEAVPGPEPVEPAEPEPTSAAPPAVESPADQEVQPDSIDPEQLKAGLEVIKPRITGMNPALGEITVEPTNRYFMHPGEDKDATMEIDTKGLSSLVLSPVIGDLSSNKDCAPPAAGVVEFSWALDGHPPERVTVDRNYRSTIPVDTSTASVLWLEVGKGNGTPLCDWFSVGFFDVKTR